jgi:hypothetical protein
MIGMGVGIYVGGTVLHLLGRRGPFTDPQA